jgi:hypothetical protein
MAESVGTFHAHLMGITPDDQWRWYAIERRADPDGESGFHIMGFVAESPELLYWGSDEPHRHYRTFFYEPSMHREGSIPMTNFKSMGDAVAFMNETWERHLKHKRLHNEAMEEDQAE